jgi:hypothetical protein
MILEFQFYLKFQPFEKSIYLLYVEDILTEK